MDPIPEARRRPRTLGAALLPVMVSWWLGATLSESASHGGATEPQLPNPILFATQVPIPADFATIGSVFANHLGGLQEAGRGGDLYIRYTDGTLCNLTGEAGYGVAAGLQGEDAIAVRDPAVHWNGDRAVFSMVVGAPNELYVYEDYFWQLYEIDGLGESCGDAIITKVANQPEDVNNVMPTYASDGRILFVSDRPRGGEPHLYPQHDEYESTPTPTGLWSLDPGAGELFLMEHAPSGSFTPIVDSFGRVIFTRWDHLQQDQQADADALNGDVYGTFDYEDESATAAMLPRSDEVFPEPRGERTDLLAGTPYTGHRLNNFFPWEIRQDGMASEILNHLGRHELHFYFNRARDDDPNLVEFIDSVSGRVNPRSIENFLQIVEHPAAPGTYVGVDAPEFQTHASGQVIRTSAAPGVNPDTVVIEYLTHPTTATVVADGAVPPAEHSGHYRDPLVLSDGTVIAAHTSETRAADNEGTRAHPVPRYDFRLAVLETASSGYLEAGAALTPGISKSLSYFDPDVEVSYTGDLWELYPVEVVARTPPAVPPLELAAPEQQIFDELGVDPVTMRSWLRDRDLALVVVRDATTRDAADRQQPFNLQVPGGTATIGASGTVYDIEDFQFFQADQLRGIGGMSSPRPGRRVIARPLHAANAMEVNPANPGGPAGSVPIALDGSVAAFVPTRRALAWQSVDGTGEGVVRERFWLSFQPGEMRACDGCHGINTANQEGGDAADNSPDALRSLLLHWLALSSIFDDGFEQALTRWDSNVQ